MAGIDVTNLVHSLGVNLAGPVQQMTNNVSYNAGAKTAPAPKQNFASSVVSSAGHIAGSIINGAAHSVAHDFTNVAHGISQGLPHIGSIAQNQQYIDHSIKQIHSAHQTYSQQYASGKITKERYNKLLKDLGGQYSDLSKKSSDNAKTIKPVDFAKSLGTVASLPLAGGNLVGQGKIATTLGATASPKSGLVGAALKAPIKAALIDAPVGQAPGSIAENVQNKNFKGAALQAGALVGAPIAVAGAAKVLPKVAAAFKDEQGFANALKFKNGTIQSVLNDYQKAGDNKSYQKLANQAKVAIDHFQAEGRTPGDIANYHATTPGHLPTANMTVEEFLAQNHDLAQASKEAQRGVATGQLALDASGKAVPKEKIPLVGAGRFSQSEQKALADRMSAADGYSGRMKVLEDDFKAKLAHTQNPSVFRALHDAAAIEDPAERAAAIKGINGTRSLVKPSSGSPTLDELIAGKNQPKIPGLELSTDKAPRPVKMPGGYIPIIKPEGAAGFKNAKKVSDTVLNPEKGILAPFTRFLRGKGVSGESTDNGMVRAALKESLDSRLKGTEFEGQGQTILKALNKAMGETKGVYDPRLLRVKPFAGAVNIEDALGVNSSQAKLISKTLRGAYADLPVSVRGLGGKITDKAIQAGGPLMTNYLKAQGYGRFTANPFFWIKQGAKGEFIGQAETGGKALNVGKTLNSMLGTAPKADTQAALKEAGWFAKGQEAGSEGDFFGGLLPGDVEKNIKSNEISQYLRQSLGQTAEAFAKQRGMSVADAIKDPSTKEEMDKVLQMVVGYPKDGYLNSNLAKTLNVLVFPSRFETKVGMATAKFVAAQPPVVQGAIATSMLHAKQWSDSPEGKKFQKDNADLLGLINYFSPTHTISSVMSFLGSGSAGDLGAVGGMPFGVISTILAHQGLKLPAGVTGSDNVNPKTGQPYVEKIPQTEKGRIQQGLTDLIGSMFSYPGATSGLPSKNQAIHAIPGMKQNSKDFKTIAPASTGSNKPSLVPARRVETTYGKAAPANPKSKAASTVQPKRAKVLVPKKGPTYSANGTRIRNRAVRPGQAF